MPWNIPLSSEEVIKKGRICVQDDAQFRTIYEVSKLFGKGYKEGTQCACFRAFPWKESNEWVWCPKLHLNDGDNKYNKYRNEISANGCTINESREKDNERFVEESYKSAKMVKRYVFAKYLCPNGEYAYKFRGVFERDNSATEKQAFVIYKMTSDTLDLTPFLKK